MGGPSKTEQSQVNLENAQANQANTASAQSSTLFNTTFPWLNTAGNYYSSLATGDPTKLAAATAPVAAQVNQQTNAAENQIRTLTPRGGAQDTSIANLETAKVGTIGSAINQAYTSAPAALASLSGQGLGLSVNEMANAISGLGQASSTLGQVGNEQAAGKASTLGFLGSLAGAGGMAAAGAGA